MRNHADETLHRRRLDRHRRQLPDDKPGTEQVAHHIRADSLAWSPDAPVQSETLVPRAVRTMIDSSAQNDGGVQALMTSQGAGPTQRKRWGRRLSK